MVDGCNRNPLHGQRPGQTLAQAHALQHVLAAGVEVPDDLGKPAVNPDGIRLAGMPDVHGAKVRPGRVLESDPVNDGHIAPVVYFFQRLRVGPERQFVIYGQQLLFGDMNPGPVIPIQRIAIRNDGIEVVVGPGKLHHHQHGVFMGGCHFLILLRWL